MTVRSVPIFLQAGSHPAEETRLMLGGLLGAATGSFSGGVAASDPAHGVVRSTDLAVSQNGTPDMSVNVATGGCFIRGTQSANQGAYHLWNDATVNVAIATSNPTNPRRDLIVAVVRDAYYSGADNDARVIVVTGTAAASPVDPTLPANALVLARVSVAANASSITTANITDLRPLASVRNQVPAFASSTERTTAIPSPYTGQLSAITAADTTNGIQQYNGSAWRLPWSLPWGFIGSTTRTTSIAATNANIITYSLAAIANRRYRITAGAGSVSSSVDSGTPPEIAGLAIQVGAGGKVAGVNIWCPFSGTGFIGGTVVGYYAPISSATVTIIAYGERVSGTGTITWGASATSPLQLFIEDIGPTGAPA